MRPPLGAADWLLVSLAVLFLLLLGAGVAAARLPHDSPAVYLALSVVTFAVYAFDKSAAKSGSRRIPEIALHLLAAVGGWPGALAAQRLLRHKTRKLSFQVVFWILVVANCAALGVLWYFWLWSHDAAMYPNAWG